MTLYVAIFLSIYFTLAAIQDVFVRLDVISHADHLSDERKTWHAISTVRAFTLGVFLLSCTAMDLPLDQVKPIKIILMTVTIRWVAMENLKNLIEGRPFMYVDKNWVNSHLHRIGGRWVEWIALILKAILITLIIIL